MRIAGANITSFNVFKRFSKNRHFKVFQIVQINLQSLQINQGINSLATGGETFSAVLCNRPISTYYHVCLNDLNIKKLFKLEPFRLLHLNLRGAPTWAISLIIRWVCIQRSYLPHHTVPPNLKSNMSRLCVTVKNRDMINLPAHNHNSYRIRRYPPNLPPPLTEEELLSINVRAPPNLCLLYLTTDYCLSRVLELVYMFDIGVMHGEFLHTALNREDNVRMQETKKNKDGNIWYALRSKSCLFRFVRQGEFIYIAHFSNKTIQSALYDENIKKYGERQNTAKWKQGQEHLSLFSGGVVGFSLIFGY